MQSIPPDLFQHVLLPFLQTSETSQDIHNLLHPSPPSVPIRNLKWSAEALENLGAIRGTCREFWQFVDGVCGYSFPEAVSAVEQGLQQMCLQKDLHKHRLRQLHAELLDAVPSVAPSYVSDGCFGCRSPLPHCWPILQPDMWPNHTEMRLERRRNVSKKRIRAFVAEGFRWVGAGCCTHACYTAFYAPILQGFHPSKEQIYIHECVWCQEPIVPSALLGKRPAETGDPLRPYFCSHGCWVGHMFMD